MIEWKPYDGKQPSEVRSPGRVRRSEAMEHPFSGRAKRDRAPEVRRNEVTEHRVRSRAKRDRPPGATELSGGAPS